MFLINVLNHTHGAMFCGNEGTKISNFLPKSQPSQSTVGRQPGWPGARVGGSQPQHPEPAGRAVTERQAVGRGDRPGLGDSACRATSPRSGKLSGRGGGVGVGERPGAGV